MTSPSHEAEIELLRRRLEEAEETIRAIHCGEVDALLVNASDGDRVYTLEGADHPYRTLIESMQQGAVSLSQDGTVLYCNRCFADMLRQSQERIIGAAAASFVEPPQQADFQSLLRQASTAGGQGEFQFQTPGGGRLPVYLALAPLGLRNAVAICMVVTDLTEQKKHQYVQETNHRKDEFLAMLAHELRNPLAPLRSALELLRLSQDETTLHAVRGIMERQIRHLVRLVDDLLDVSRVMRGRIELRKEHLSLDSVVAHAVEESKPLADEQGHTLQVKLPAEPVWVDADPIRLTQIIANLLNNAAKYTKPGGRISLAIEQQDSLAVIRVRDSGIGIAPEMLPHVFDLFSQADCSLDRSQGGLGVGLAVVRMLTEMHGGSIEAHSEGLGLGSEFVLRLPLSPKAKKKETAEWRPSAISPRRVLVVDDNQSAAEVLSMLLTRCWGHEVLVAHDGQSALEKAKTFHPEMVLLDIGLPGLNGYQVAERLRQQPETIDAVIVALTGYGQDEDRRRSSEAGFDEHLIKPVSVAHLEVLFTHARLVGT
jgi:PAS domain S-box-containing protein